MKTKLKFPKWLAIVGDVLMWLPLAAPVILGLLRLAGGESFLLDYLMPGEVFPVALVGMILLLWAAIARRTLRTAIGATIAASFVGLIGCQLVAEVTGLASGAIGPTGWQWITVMSLLGLYILALAVLGVLGIMLVRRWGE
jgi:hypothetical protein